MMPIRALFSLFLIGSIHLPLLTDAQCGQDREWQNPLPQANSLKDVEVLNDHTRMVVGNNGTLLRTSDGGNTWDIDHCLQGLEGYSLSALHFIDDTSGWVVGGWAVFYTNDGGVDRSVKAQLPSPPRDVFFLNDPIGYVVLMKVQFVNDKTGWIVGGNYVHRSSDGGDNWTRFEPDSSQFAFYDGHFMDPWRGWVVGSQGEAHYTTYGGQNWTHTNIGTSKDLFSVHFEEGSRDGP